MDAPGLAYVQTSSNSWWLRYGDRVHERAVRRRGNLPLYRFKHQRRIYRHIRRPCSRCRVYVGFKSSYLPPSKEVMFSLRSVCLSVCLCPSDNWKSCERILAKFLGGVGHCPGSNEFNFGDDPDHRPDPVVRSPKSGFTRLSIMLAFGGGLLSLTTSSFFCFLIIPSSSSSYLFPTARMSIRSEVLWSGEFVGWFVRSRRSLWFL